MTFVDGRGIPRFLIVLDKKNISYVIVFYRVLQKCQRRKKDASLKLKLRLPNLRSVRREKPVTLCIYMYVHTYLHTLHTTYYILVHTTYCTLRTINYYYF